MDEVFVGNSPAWAWLVSETHSTSPAWTRLVAGGRVDSSVIGYSVDCLPRILRLEVEYDVTRPVLIVAVEDPVKGERLTSS